MRLLLESLEAGAQVRIGQAIAPSRGEEQAAGFLDLAIGLLDSWVAHARCRCHAGSFASGVVPFHPYLNRNHGRKSPEIGTGDIHVNGSVCQFVHHFEWEIDVRVDGFEHLSSK